MDGVVEGGEDVGVGAAVPADLVRGEAGAGGAAAGCPAALPVDTGTADEGAAGG